MRRTAELWWERRRLWLPGAVLVVLAVAALVGYRVALAGRVGLEAGEVRERREELAELSARRRASEGLLQQARANRSAIDGLYAERLGSQSRRLTAVMLQVKQLARQAGLTGVQAIDYGDQLVEELPLRHKSIGFAATGTYEQLRSFINLLELSETFLTLEEIRVQDTEQTGRLALQIRLSTLFAEEDAAAATAEAAPPEAEPGPPAPPPAAATPAALREEIDA
jgi:Tfp pilus assembly protein PilO